MQAIEKVLPLPVTPRSVWCLSPRAIPSTSASIAAGWSPDGSNSDSSLKALLMGAV